MLFINFLTFFIFSLVTSSHADITSDNIKNSLKKPLTHPYLYFSDADKPAMLARITNEQEYSDIFRRLLAEANRNLYMPVNPQYPAQSKHPRFDQKHDFEDYLTGYTQKALELAFIYQMTGEKKYAEKAFEFADALCDIPAWMMRHHEFPIIYTRVWPWNVNDDQVVFNFDHVTGDISRDFAAIYDWLYPALSKPQRDRIRGAILEKVITRVRGNYDYQWWASAYRCNWCGVCFSGIGCCAIALLTEDPGLTDVIAESHNRISRMFDEIDSDGGWQEGCVYWSYGVETSVFFADALKRLTNGSYNLFTHPKIAKNTINCALYNYIPPNMTLNFEDSNLRLVGDPYFYSKLADETQSKESAWFRNNIMGYSMNIFDIIWPKTQVQPGLPEQASLHFRGIDWAVMRSDFTDTDKAFVACKAGYNDDPHHGHLDCGNFVVYWRTEGFVSEIQRSIFKSTDEKFFDEDRWQYPQASSAGHNLIFVNGELQIPAKLKDKPWKEGIGGKILEFRTGKTRDYTLMDPTHAYPNKELKGWRRHIILEKPVITVVVDEVSSNAGAEIESRFHSEVTQTPKGDYLLLDGAQGDMALIPVVDGDFSLRQGKHASLSLRMDAVFEWKSYCGVVVKAKSPSTVIATIILPVENGDEASNIVTSVKRTIDKTGNLTLSFSKTGKTYTYFFRKGKDGLVLE